MFDICLFDLDDTLIRTEDLEWDREACKNSCNQDLLANVTSALASRYDRHIYSMETLTKIRSSFPNLKLGVFTRSPRSYAETALKWAYPCFKWDILIAYEDVTKTKPYGYGITKAMNNFGVNRLDRVIFVGDSDIDIRSGYHCGCVVALDKSAWPKRLERQHWNALELIPDAVICSPMELIDVLNNPYAFLPELERVFMENTLSNRVPRFDKINHFIPRTAGGDTTAYPIYVCGRSFANYKSVQNRKQWHILTESIGKNKDSDSFPYEWVQTIRTFIENEYSMSFCLNLVVTVIPHRPGRKPRLENFLRQLEIFIQSNPIKNLTISFQSQLLAYKSGVKSQHNDYLDHQNRFINVRDHLIVQMSEIKWPTSYIIIDDVATTGASLIYASKYLKNRGAYDVKCLSIAKNISDVLYQR